MLNCSKCVYICHINSFNCAGLDLLFCEPVFLFGVSVYVCSLAVRLLTRSTFAHSQLKMWVSRTERPPHLYNRVKGLPMRIHDLVLLLTLLSVWFNKVYHFVCELLRVATLYPTEVGFTTERHQKITFAHTTNSLC